MRPLLSLIRAGLLSVACLSQPAVADGRVALVIGNSAYKAAPLVNPEYDAMGIGAALWTAGFDVRIGVDLTKAEMDEALQAFKTAANQSDIAFLHYSGHGVQLKGENYLLPVEFTLTHEHNVPATAISGTKLIDALKGAKLAVLALDACRDNPFPRNIGSAARSVSVANGLASMDSRDRENLLVAFSTGPGETALDGDGAHSPFSGAIIDNIARDEEVSLVFQRVRDEVNKQTDRKQVPWGHSNLYGKHVLAGSLPERARAERIAVAENWSQALIANSPEAYQTFLTRNPDNPFVPVARKKLARAHSGAVQAGEKSRAIALARQFRFQPK